MQILLVKAVGLVLLVAGSYLILMACVNLERRRSKRDGRIFR